MCAQPDIELFGGGVLPGSGGTHWQQEAAQPQRSAGVAGLQAKHSSPQPRPVTGVHESEGLEASVFILGSTRCHTAGWETRGGGGFPYYSYPWPEIRSFRSSLSSVRVSM